MNRSYKIRTLFVFIAFLLFYFVALFNLFLIQVKQHSFFTHLADKQYSISLKQTPPRAEIFDRHGAPLALNKEGFAAFLLPRMIVKQEHIYNFLQKYFPEALTRLKQNSDKHFMYIKRRLTPKEIEVITQEAPEEIKIFKEPSRYYPVEATSSIVGITDIDNTGLMGIELSFNKQLAGLPTTLSLKKDARSGYFYIQQKTKIPGTDGRPVSLTLDATLQFLVLEELVDAIKKFNAQEGAVLIMEPSSGEILSMVSYPTFDPNKTDRLNIETTKNRCITDAYELGSVIKAFAALAAFEEEVVTPNELIDCENRYETYLNGIHLTTTAPHGIIPFSTVVQKSNNIGMAKVISRLDKKLYEHYKRLGFTQKTEISLPGEHHGFINPPNKWSKQSIFSLSYGYEISATLLQLSSAFCMIANDGIPIKPKIILDTSKSEIKETCKNRLYGKKSLSIIKQILEETVLHGSGRRGHIKEFTIRGKTGTANLIVNRVYSKDHNIYTFAGIVEKGTYQRVIITFVKNVGIKNVLAAHIAVPLFRQVAEKMVIHDKMI